MSTEVDTLINEIQSNLQRVISLADEISNEYRRLIQVDMTTKGRNIKLLRELLETDNKMRDTIADLRKATSAINFNTDKAAMLNDQEFLAELFGNLTELFKSFENIHEIMEFDQNRIDNVVLHTIDSIEKFTSR